jgi:FAD:protein FMN transferase
MPMNRFPDSPDLRRFRGAAMNTAFEVFMAHTDPDAAAQAAHDAFRAAEALESELSRFLPNSDVSRINRLEAGCSVRVCPDTFECLRRGLEWQDITGGAFDLTAGAGTGGPPADLTAVPGSGGPPPIRLDDGAMEVRVTRRVTVDLGAIGKGFAVDRMTEILREWDVPAALVHGGMSSVAAYGALPGHAGWPVTLHRPTEAGRASAYRGQRPELLERCELTGNAIGASGVEKGGHIIDPSTGRPVAGRIAAWAFADDATSADALSTAFMVMDPESVRIFCGSHRGVRAIVIGEDGTIHRFGTGQGA